MMKWFLRGVLHEILCMVGLHSWKPTGYRTATGVFVTCRHCSRPEWKPWL